MLTLIRKVLAVLVVILIVILIVIITISYANHKIKLKKEIEKLTPIGKMVKVNSHMMHVYSEGKGEDTLVFMSGGGTSSPLLDFKSLYSRLSDKYRIAVLEKAGYGFSEEAKVSRDIDTILEETRRVLELSGEKPPYILFPHSMSGIEAIYWAQKYPEEVKGIIGLDPAIPEAYEKFPLPSKLNQGLAYFGARIGITRFIPNVCESSPAIKENLLSDEEKDVYRAVFYKSTLTSNMLQEVKVIKENAKKVGEKCIPIDTPMYFFISDGKEIPLDNWRGLLSGYTKKLKYGKYMYLDCGHYVHGYKQDIISEESTKFIESIINKI